MLETTQSVVHHVKSFKNPFLKSWIEKKAAGMDLLDIVGLGQDRPGSHILADVKVVSAG